MKGRPMVTSDKRTKPMQQHDVVSDGARPAARYHSASNPGCVCLPQPSRTPASVPRKRLDHSRMAIRDLVHATPASRNLPSHSVQARELQTALLVVLALYASVGLMNLTTEWSVLRRIWPSLMEFLVNGVLRP